MRRAIDAYREGYEKGRQDNLAGHVTEATVVPANPVSMARNSCMRATALG